MRERERGGESDVIIPVLSDSETASYEPHSVVHGSLSLP